MAVIYHDEDFVQMNNILQKDSVKHYLMGETKYFFDTSYIPYQEYIWKSLAEASKKK